MKIQVHEAVTFSLCMVKMHQQTYLSIYIQTYAGKKSACFLTQSGKKLRIRSVGKRTYPWRTLALFYVGLTVIPSGAIAAYRSGCCNLTTNIKRVGYPLLFSSVCLSKP